MEQKVCSKCENEKDISDFTFRKDINNYRNVCRICNNDRNKELKKTKFENFEWKHFPNELKCITCEQTKSIDCFHKRRDTQLGIRRNCKSCLNIYYLERRKLNSYFKLSTNLRSRTRDAFKAQHVKKENKTFDLLGCSHSFLKSWIEFQLYGDMTMQNYGKVWHLDHCLPVSSFNLMNENEKRKCFFWLNLRPMYVKDNIIKGNKVDIWLYILQEVKANYFTKLNEEERYNQNFY